MTHGNPADSDGCSEIDPARWLRDIFEGSTDLAGQQSVLLLPLTQDPTESVDSDGFGDNPDPFLSTPSIFFDTQPDHWAFSFVENLTRANITAGCGNDIFCPEDAVTRAQMAVLLVRTFGL